jgi:hypothetical protein
MARSSSASLGAPRGAFSEVSGMLAGGTGRVSAVMPPGSSRPFASIDFLSEAFSRCSRAISLSSASRSSGAALQDQPMALELHCATWPVVESSRTKASPMRWKV